MASLLLVRARRGLTFARKRRRIRKAAQTVMSSLLLVSAATGLNNDTKNEAQTRQQHGTGLSLHGLSEVQSGFQA